MDLHVLELLQATQSSNDGLRKDAESQLEQLYTNEAFAISLVSIAAQKSDPPNMRQSSLLVLKAFILKAWSPSLDDFGGQVLISDTNKEQLRQALLTIVVNGDDDRKVTSAAAYAVSKIASVDFPEDWPSLLPTLLHAVPHSSEDQLHGLLMVLGELVEDGFDVEQFATSARELVTCLYAVAVDHEKKLTHRALSVSIFRACFDTLDMMYDKNNAMLKNFMHEASDAWLPFFIDVLKLPLPGMPSDEDEHKGTTVFVEWRGVVALKIQVVKVSGRVFSINNSPLSSSRRWIRSNLPSPSSSPHSRFTFSAQFGKLCKYTWNLTIPSTYTRIGRVAWKTQIGYHTRWTF